MGEEQDNNAPKTQQDIDDARLLLDDDTIDVELGRHGRPQRTGPVPPSPTSYSSQSSQSRPDYSGLLKEGKLDEYLMAEKISLDQVRQFQWWRATGRPWRQAAARADISEEPAWALENDQDMQEEIARQRQDMEYDPQKYLLQMMPNVLGELRQQVVDGKTTAIEATLKANMDFERVKRISGKGSRGGDISEIRGVGKTLPERKSINRTVNSIAQRRFGRNGDSASFAPGDSNAK